MNGLGNNFRIVKAKKKKLSKNNLHQETVEIHGKKKNYTAKRWKKDDIPIRGLEHGKSESGNKKLVGKPAGEKRLSVSDKPTIRDGLRTTIGDGKGGGSGSHNEKPTEHGGLAEQRPPKLKIKIKKPIKEAPTRDANSIYDGEIPELREDFLLAEDSLKHNKPTPDTIGLNSPSLLELKDAILKNGYTCTVENKRKAGWNKIPEGMSESDWGEIIQGKRPYLEVYNKQKGQNFILVNTNKKGKDVVQILRPSIPRRDTPVFQVNLKYVSKAVLSVPDLFKKIFDHSPIFDGEIEKAKEEVSSHIAEKKDVEIKSKAKAILGRVEKRYTTEDYQILKRYEENGGQIPKDVIKKTWEILTPYFGANSKILDPSSGIGSWCEGKSKEYNFTLLEKDPISTEIGKILYPNANIKNQQFEELFMNRLGKPEKDYKGDKYDGVVGFPPTGKIDGKYKGIEGKGFTRYEDYFLSRSLDTLKEGGIIGMFLPSTFLSKGGLSDRSKQKVLDKCEVLDAYRFPEKSFPNEKIGMDFVILRKNTTSSKTNELAYGDKFFKKNKDKIFGKNIQITNSKKKVKDELVGDIQSFLSYTPKEGVFKSIAMSEEQKHKISESMIGNQNALGHHGNGREASEDTAEGKKGRKKKIKDEVFRIAGETRSEEDFVKEYMKHIDPIDLENHKHINHLGQYDMDKVKYLKDHTFFHNGSYYPKYLYLSGNITDKLIDLAEYDKGELIKKHGQDAYEHQLKSLKSLLPKEIEIKDISFSPLEPFAENHMIGEGNSWYVKTIQEKDALGVIGDKLGTGFIRGSLVVQNGSSSERNLFDTDILGSLILAKNENSETQGRRSKRGRGGESSSITNPNENDYALFLKGETVTSPDGEIRTKIYQITSKTHDGGKPTIPDRAIGLQIMRELYNSGQIPYPQEILSTRGAGESMERFKQRLEREYPGNFIIPESDKIGITVAKVKNFAGDLQKFSNNFAKTLLEERMGDASEDLEYHRLSLKEAFMKHFESLSADVILNMGCPKQEVKNYLNGDDISSGRDMTSEERARMAQNRKNVADSLFSSFIDELPKEVKDNIQKEYNHIFNSFTPVNGKNVPLTVDGIGKKFKGYDLHVKEKQIENSARHINMGTGIDVAEVGVGKTMIGILSTVANMQKGNCKRPLVVVPANLLGKWEYEFSQIFPTLKINKLGTDQVNDFIKNNKTGVPYEPEDGSITIMSSSVFQEKFRFSKEIGDQLTKDIGDQFGDPDEKKDEKKPDSPESKICLIDKAGFDSITVDEAHKMNKILFNTDNEKKRWGRNEFPDIAGGDASKVGRKLLLTSRYIAKNNNGKNVLLLTATPTTNNPLELYSLLTVVKKDQLDRMGIKSSKDFLNTFAKTSIEYVPVAGEVGVKPKTVVRGYKNARAFKNLVQGFMLHTTGEEAGVERPAIDRSVVLVPETKTQSEMREQMQKIYSKSGERGRGEYALMSIMGQRMNNMSPHLIGKDTALANAWDELRNELGGSGASLPEIVNVPEYITNGMVTKARKENFLSMNSSEKENYAKKHNIPDHSDFYDSVKHNIQSSEHYLAGKIAGDSNKTKLALDTIGELYNQHKGIKDMPMSGQLLFVPQGLRVPGHDGVSTLDCYKKYISERHNIPLEAIGVMDARPDMKKARKDANGEEVTKWDEMVKNYNNPNHPLKIIIGSDVINEGVDLNGCTMVSHNLAPDWNPTNMVQKEGRSRRQGNRLNLAQFRNYCVENSVDSVLLQKIGEKTDRINAVFMKGDDGANFIDTSDINPDDVKLEIIRDPLIRASLEAEQESRQKKFELRAMSSKVQKIYSIMGDIKESHLGVQSAYERLEKVKLNSLKLSGDRLAFEINKATKSVEKAEKSYGNQLSRLSKISPSYKETQNDWDFTEGNERNLDVLKELSSISGKMENDFNKAEKDFDVEHSKNFEEKHKKYTELEKKRKESNQSKNWESSDFYNKMVKDSASEILKKGLDAGHKHEKLSDGTWKSSILTKLGYIPVTNAYRTLMKGFIEYKKYLFYEKGEIYKSGIMNFILKAKKGEKLDKSKLILVRKIVHKPNKKPYPQSYWVSPDKAKKYLSEGYHIVENKHLVEGHTPEPTKKVKQTKKEKLKQTEPKSEKVSVESNEQQELDPLENPYKEKLKNEFEGINVKELKDELKDIIEEENEDISETIKVQLKDVLEEKKKKTKTGFKKLNVKTRDIYVKDLPYVSPEEYSIGLDEDTIKNPHLRITQNEYNYIYHHPDMNMRINWLFRFMERLCLSNSIKVNHHEQNVIKYDLRDLDGNAKHTGIFKFLVRSVLQKHIDDDAFEDIYQKCLQSLFNLSQDPEKFKKKIKENKPELLHLWLSGFVKNNSRNFKKQKAIENTTIVKDALGNTVYDENGHPKRHYSTHMDESEENRTQFINGLYSPSPEEVFFGRSDEDYNMEKLLEQQKQEIMQIQSFYQMGVDFIEGKRGNSSTTDRDLAIWEVYNKQLSGEGNHMKGKVDYKKIAIELSKRGIGIPNSNTLKNSIRAVNNHVIQFNPYKNSKGNNMGENVESKKLSDMEVPENWNHESIYTDVPIKITIRPDGIPVAKISDKYPQTSVQPEVISYFNKMSPFNKHAKAKLNKLNTDIEAMENPFDITHQKNRGMVSFISMDMIRDNKGKKNNTYRVHAFYKRIYDSFGAVKQIAVYLKKVKLDNRDVDGKKIKSPPKPRGRKKENEKVSVEIPKTSEIPIVKEIKKPRERIKAVELLDKNKNDGITTKRKPGGKGTKAPVW